MGRDLHEGYKRLIEHAKVLQDFSATGYVRQMDTTQVANLVGCLTGHAVIIARAIPNEHAIVWQKGRRLWLEITDTSFTPEQLAGWIQTYRAKIKHANDGVPEKAELEPQVATVGLSEDYTHIIKTLSYHEDRILELERKLKAGTYLDPARVAKRRFFGLFS
jgi:hypothetical protein